MPSKYSGEFNLTGDEGIDFNEYIENAASVSRSINRQKQIKSVNEVGVVPELPPEVIAERDMYQKDFVKSLQEIFPESTGLKPFGKVQIDSTKFMKYIMDNGGRLILLEPRGYAKTTRITNTALLAALSGCQPYIVIVASSTKKAEDILDDVRTELTTNEKLYELYPATCACFRHLARSPQKTRRQTYNGEFTYIQNSLDAIHFPAVPGEPSSGCIIQVRPATNLKGLKHKIEAGPRKGKVERPTLYIFDDPQTEDEAASAPMRRKIIKNIKRSALKGGTHQRPVSAIMAVTPVEYGDVPWHFVTNEESWDLVRYKMVEKFPDSEELWFGKYAEIRSNFNREIRGDRARARLEARKFVMEHYEEMHNGSQVTWEWAFNPNEPQFEVSALQHAYNIILDDGREDFEFECQCNIEYGIYEEDDQMHAPEEQILTKINNFPRGTVPQESATIVTHIDTNKEILTYVTMASGPNFRPFIIDYGTWPQQPGRWTKKKMTNQLRDKYPEAVDHREVLYLGAIDLFKYLAQKKYRREDGVLRSNNVIGIDIRYEEVYLTRACRESEFSNIILPVWGTYVGPDDDLLHERSYSDSVQIYDNCVEVPNKDKTLDILKVDVNFYKTEVHKALNKKLGIVGSLSLWKEGDHKQFAEHCNIEYPTRVPGKKSIRTKITWKEKVSQPDNELFDNATGCFALFAREGINLAVREEEFKHTASNQITVLEDLMKKESNTNLW